MAGYCRRKRDKIKRSEVELNQSLDKASVRLNHDINTLILSRYEYTKQISRLDDIWKDAKNVGACHKFRDS